MDLLNRTFAASLLAMLFTLLLLGAFGVTPARAHLMVAQHGTLNIVDDGAFMVLSLPISAFDGLDENADGRVSMLEFNNQRSVVVSLIRAHVVLTDAEGPAPLQGIMLSPVRPHGVNDASISELIVMGRFDVNQPDGELHFHVSLFGNGADEQSIEMTAKRQQNGQEHSFELTPDRRASTLFPTYVTQGDSAGPLCGLSL